MSKHKQPAPAPAPEHRDYGAGVEPGFFEEFVSDAGEVRGVVHKNKPRCPWCATINDAPKPPASAHELTCAKCEKCFVCYSFRMAGAAFFASMATNLISWMQFVALDHFGKKNKAR